MSSPAEQLVDQFLEPLLQGGELVIGAPISPQKRALLNDGSLWEHDAGLCRLRENQARLLIESPDLGLPEPEEVDLWVGLHNLLALDHPDVGRVWARDVTWQLVEADTRRAISALRIDGVSSIVLRHVWTGAVCNLMREDHVVAEGEQNRRYRGQKPPQRGFAGIGRASGSARSEMVRWVDSEHSAATERLLGELLWKSPLTCLLDPRRAPAQWTPLNELAGACLHDRALVRSICYSWERRADWVLVGANLTRRLLEGLGVAHLVAQSVPSRPGVVRAPQAAASPVSGHRTDSVPALSEPAMNAEPSMASGDAEVVGGEPSSALLGIEADPGTDGSSTPKALPGLRPEDVAVYTAALVGALVHLHVLKVFEFDARIGLGSSSRDWAVQAFLSLPLVAGQLESTLGSPLVGAESTGFSRRWEEYTDHLRGLVPRPVLENMLATLVARIVEDTQR